MPLRLMVDPQGGAVGGGTDGGSDVVVAAKQQDDDCDVIVLPKAAPAVIDVDEAPQRRTRAPPQRFKPRASLAPGRLKRKLPSSPAHDDGPPIKIKHEDSDGGLIRCPSCTSALNIGTGGCALQVCTRTDHPGGGWFYFCFHCREHLGEGQHCNTCPMENNRETRQLMKRRRNNASRRDPIVFD